MSITTAALPPIAEPPTPDSPPEFLRGDLISSLESVVENAEGADVVGVEPVGVARTRSGPALILKQDGRNYFRLTELPPEAALHCANVDCPHQAKLLLDSRDAEVLPYCRGCAHVEFAMWMAGV